MCKFTISFLQIKLSPLTVTKEKMRLNLKWHIRAIYTGENKTRLM